MYRIDEDTYIDDSLVTCAEYQLFIDEMRKKGEFCQPDHWTSYQFPTGQARIPILGVQPSNANAFCLWLSKHEADKWVYRLPTLNEAMQYPISQKDEILCGYWTMDENKYSFAWIGPPPKNQHSINLFIISTNNNDFSSNNSIAIDPSILQNRITGFSPALEGIRIVKEHLKSYNHISNQKGAIL